MGDIFRNFIEKNDGKCFEFLEKIPKKICTLLMNNYIDVEVKFFNEILNMKFLHLQKTQENNLLASIENKLNNFIVAEENFSDVKKFDGFDELINIPIMETLEINKLIEIFFNFLKNFSKKIIKKNYTSSSNLVIFILNKLNEIENFSAEKSLNLDFEKFDKTEIYEIFLKNIYPEENKNYEEEKILILKFNIMDEIKKDNEKLLSKEIDLNYANKKYPNKVH